MRIKNLSVFVAVGNLWAETMGIQNFAVITVKRNTEEWKELTTLKWSVLSVARNLLKTSTQKKKRVQESVEQNYLSIVEIKYVGKEDVYNMEVRNHHNYSVCGGFIIHNCMDAIRYAVMGAWRWIKRWLPEETEKEEELESVIDKETEQDEYI